jgi:Uma2 family endonuclease
MTALLYPPSAVRPIPAPPATGPAPIRWTCDTYRKLGPTGVFDDLKTMLLDGVIYVMPLPDPPHNTGLILTEDALRKAFPTGHHIRNQMALDVGTTNDPGPDLAVVPGAARDYAARQATTAALVVEVADSSLFVDTTTKVELYATAAVPEYWVLDLTNRQLIVFRDPGPLAANGHTYRTKLTLGETGTVTPLAAPGAVIPVADLLP